MSTSRSLIMLVSRFVSLELKAISYLNTARSDDLGYGRSAVGPLYVRRMIPIHPGLILLSLSLLCSLGLLRCVDSRFFYRYVYPYGLVSIEFATFTPVLVQLPTAAISDAIDIIFTSSALLEYALLCSPCASRLTMRTMVCFTQA